MQWKSLAAASLLCSLSAPAGAVGNIAEVAIYDRAEQRVLPFYRHQGRYYVVGTPGTEYQIRVRNRSGVELLAVVSVDGINAVTGETASWHQSGYVLSPQQTLDIEGWRKSLQRVAAFFFTEHQNSYAARTARPDNVGVIGIALFRRKPEPETRIDRPPPRLDTPGGAADDGPFPPSADFGSAPSGARSAESAVPRHVPFPYPAEKSSALGTGHGRSLSSHARYVAFERATRNPEEVVTIHYDSYRNLVALGVIRAPRLATPFPGQFVPDPR